MDSKKEIPLAWRDHLATISRLGGKSTSVAKQQASRRNVLKAFQTRYPGRALTPKLIEIEQELAEIESDAAPQE